MMSKISNSPTPLAALVLDWYDRHHRDLPWRVSPSMRARGIAADPYHVWLSEIMLQQTTVQVVKPYFLAFLARWPRVTDLASAETEDVMKAWAGLGYYARARNLKKCADAVARDHGGKFPDTEEELRTLPGIGDYTAAAIAAIAFLRRAVVIDGNIERVVSRLFAFDAPLPGSKPALKMLVDDITPDQRAGDFAQAMMDLGATICTPKRPACVLCPLKETCAALLADDPERFPVKSPKKTKPVRLGAAFIAINPDNQMLLQKRPANGLLGGMTQVPTTAWTSRTDGGTERSHAPFVADWQAKGIISHGFTHFELRLSVYLANTGTFAHADGWWEPLETLHRQALPTVMKKAIAAAIDPEPGAIR